ncbi:angiopoietin-related protein 7-like [Ruditapes philippinarum]|uniref:angiopoietin-related protein 7-like n=1 Tax=Ruditapes philippinarum TaxID=129788 RepID=UPI00295BA4F0|nr:angiopoietin-related protein 7-like [Ruditapes philippinarum]
MKIVFIPLLIVGIFYASANDLILVQERIQNLENRVNSESEFRNEEATRIRREISEPYCEISLNKTDMAISRIEETSELIVSEVSKKHVTLLNQMNENSLHDSQYLQDITSKLEQLKNNTDEIEAISVIDSKRNYVTAATVERNKEIIERIYLLVTDLFTNNIKPLSTQVSRIEETSELIVSEVSKKHVTLLNEMNENSLHDSQYLQDITSKLEQLKTNTGEIEAITVIDSKRNYVTAAMVGRNQEILERIYLLVEDLFTNNIKPLLTQVSRIEETSELIESEVSKKHVTLLNEINETSAHNSKQLKDIAIKLEQVKKNTDYSIIENNKRFDAIAANVEANNVNIERVYSLVTEVSTNIKTLLKHVSCIELLNNGITHSSTHQLRNGLMVYCDQTTDGGGWIVFQRRLNGEVDFYRNWAEYKNGFGDLNGEFWLGNEHLSLLTANGTHELRIELEDFDGNSTYAKYSKFKIYPEEDNYKLEVSGYSGTAWDSLDFHNGMMFSTFDRDNDKNSDNCALGRHGAWWYNSCYHSNLNGKYYNTSRPELDAIRWRIQKFTLMTAKTVEMKFRSIDSR